ncbi:MAG: response regulator [Balneolaceae bacterium]
MIKVMITDDHQLVREGLKRIVNEDTNDIKVVQEASNSAELLNCLTKELPDIVVLDIAMPGRGGLDVLKDIKEFYPKLPVLVLSMHPEDRFAIRAIKAGASGYLTKTSISDELVKAIRIIVNQKKRYISSNVAEQLAEQMDRNFAKNKHETLSDREYQILCMIASGKKSSLIAEELSLSVQTIHTYRARLKQKMNITSVVDLTRYAIQHNLID